MCFDLKILSLRLQKKTVQTSWKNLFVWVSIFSIDFTGLVASKHLIYLLKSILSVVIKIKTNQVTRPSDAIQICNWLRSLIDADQHLRGQRVCAIKRDVLRSKVQIFFVNNSNNNSNSCGCALPSGRPTYVQYFQLLGWCWHPKLFRSWSGAVFQIFLLKVCRFEACFYGREKLPTQMRHWNIYRGQFIDKNTNIVFPIDNR